MVPRRSGKQRDAQEEWKDREDEEDDERRPSRSRTRDTDSTDMKSRAPDLTNDFSKKTNNSIRITHTAVLGTLLLVSWLSSFHPSSSLNATATSQLWPQGGPDGW
jgi:hypothetical protein